MRDNQHVASLPPHQNDALCVSKRGREDNLHIVDRVGGAPDADHRIEAGRSAAVPFKDDCIVEGLARVVSNPNVDEPPSVGEILVCALTDPSWTPMFMMAEGLVIDIGGVASHGAIVARELGVPCVINTETGTIDINTGDRLIVDGSEGVVHIVERAQ